MASRQPLLLREDGEQRLRVGCVVQLDSLLRGGVSGMGYFPSLRAVMQHLVLHLVEDRADELGLSFGIVRADVPDMPDGSHVRIVRAPVIPDGIADREGVMLRHEASPIRSGCNSEHSGSQEPFGGHRSGA